MAHYCCGQQCTNTLKFKAVCNQFVKKPQKKTRLQIFWNTEKLTLPLQGVGTTFCLILPLTMDSSITLGEKHRFKSSKTKANNLWVLWVFAGTLYLQWNKGRQKCMFFKQTGTFGVSGKRFYRKLQKDHKLHSAITRGGMSHCVKFHTCCKMSYKRL